MIPTMMLMASGIFLCSSITATIIQQLPLESDFSDEIKLSDDSPSQELLSLDGSARYPSHLMALRPDYNILSFFNVLKNVFENRSGADKRQARNVQIPQYRPRRFFSRLLPNY